MAFSPLGIVVIVSQSILPFDALKWFGAAYLIYIGLRSLMVGRHDECEVAEAGEAGEAEMGISRAFRSTFGWYALVALFVSDRAIRDRFRAIAHWSSRRRGPC